MGVFCSHGVTLGGFLDGGGHWKDQAMTRSLKLSALLPPSLQEGVRGWRWSESSVMPVGGSLHKSLWTPGFRKLLVDGASGEGMELWAPPHIPCPVHPLHLSVHLYPL